MKLIKKKPAGKVAYEAMVHSSRWSFKLTRLTHKQRASLKFIATDCEIDVELSKRNMAELIAMFMDLEKEMPCDTQSQ